MNVIKFNPPKDHIFGDMDHPKNSAGWLRERYKGVHHYHQITPNNPNAGDKVCLHVTTSVNQPIESVYLWMTIDDWKTQTEFKFTKHEVIWQTAIWSYLQEWTITLPAQPEYTMLRYKIGAKLQGSQAILYADSQARSFTEGTHYSVWYGGKSNPNWSKDAIVYQIFVDRFNRGGGRLWEETSDLRQFSGGTLEGVIEKLPFIESMGFNTIWLTPIFESPSHHGYDISDYFQINSRFGSLDDFQKLLGVAHQYQMKVLLDFVANHCSSAHPFFQDAINDPHSHYHDFFVWNEWPRYECFYNVRSMPKWNLAYGAPARQYMLDCAQYWLKLGVDGFRLDYAHGPKQDFWVDFRRACAQVNAEHWTFAEIVQPPDVQMTYAGGVGGILDFLLCQAIRSTFGQLTWSLAEFSSFIEAHFDYFNEDISLPSFFDNHDMNRFMVTTDNDVRLLKLALLVLYALPGPPIIYYGTEIPLSQNRSIHAKDTQGFDEARLPMQWAWVDESSLIEYLGKLADVRQKWPVLWQTGWVVHELDEQKDFIILGKKESCDHYMLINRSEKEVSVSINTHGHENYYDLIGERLLSCEDGRLTLSLKPISGLLISAEMHQ